MTENFLLSGSDERFKGAVHGLLFGIAALVGLYNVSAYRKRHKRHLLVNSVVYGALTAFEVFQVAHHFGKD